MRKLTPLKAIRKYCLWCVYEKPNNEVLLCPIRDCPFYPFRLGKKEKKGSTLKAIRQICKDCDEGTALAVKNCEFPGCPLYVYRFGRNPALKGKRGNPEALKRYRSKREKKAETSSTT